MFIRRALLNLQHLFEALFALTLKHHLAVTILAAISFVGLNFAIARMDTHFTVEDTLDPALPSVASSRRLTNDFKSGLALYIIFKNKDGQIGEVELCRIYKAIHQKLENEPLSARIIGKTSLFSIRHGLAEGQKLWLPKLVDLPCFGSGQNPALNHAENLVEVEAALKDSPWANMLLARKDGDTIVAMVRFAEVARDFDGKSIYDSLPAETLDQVRSFFQREFSDLPGLLITFTGPAAFRGYARDATNRDMAVNLLIPIILILVFRVCYGTWRGGMLLALAIMIMRTLVLGLMAVCGYKADPLTGSLVLLVTGAAIEDFIFVSEQRRQGVAWQKAFHNLLIPSFLTSLTTAVGFASLTLSEISTVRTVGLWAAIGAFLQWVAVFYILPALLQTFPVLRAWVHEKRSLTYANSLLRLHLRWHFACKILVLLLVVTAPFLIHRFRIEEDLNSFFPSDHPWVTANEQLQRDFGWQITVDLLVDQSLKIEHRQQLREALRKTSGVIVVESLDDVKAFMGKGLSQLDQENVDRLFRTTDDFSSYEAADRTEHWQIFVNKADVATIDRLDQTIRAICPANCRLAGPLAVYRDFTKEVVGTLVESMMTSIGLVLVILFGLAYAWRIQGVFAIIISSLFGVAALIVLLFLAGVQMSFVSCLFVSVLVGLCGDNAIQFMYSARDRPLEMGIRHLSRGAFVSIIMTISVALLFLLSAFQPARSLGVILSIGLVLNVFGDVWVLLLFAPRDDKKSPVEAETHWHTNQNSLS